MSEQMEFDFDQFKADRLRVLTNLDVAEFREYLAKYDEPRSAKMEDITLLAGMHYARLNADFMPAEAKEISVKWLRQNGYNPYPKFG